ncbi:hypothetical protein TNCV_4844941 [Trichonephila clavipes]|uniref:Uncharacterized protein n=1 Tax=Trichonephila clavipes TaxID=2585209 RepID=A0A8X7BMU3_TRICX|nr:hypothetical protein TNCV_4844941 [Trichonephila clavipes]
MVKCEPNNLRFMPQKAQCFVNRVGSCHSLQRPTSQQCFNEANLYQCNQPQDRAEEFQEQKPQSYLTIRIPQANLKKLEPKQRFRDQGPYKCTKTRESNQCLNKQRLCCCSLCHGKDFKVNNKDEACDYCNKKVTYQTFKVCDCGYIPLKNSDTFSTTRPRITGLGDASFIKKPAKSSTGDPHTFFYCVKRK